MTDKTKHTPPSSIRIPLPLKRFAQERAKSEGRTLTDVIVELLKSYVLSEPRD